MAPSTPSSSDSSSLDLLNIKPTIDDFVPTSTEQYLTHLTLRLFEETLNNRNLETPLIRHWSPSIQQDFEVLDPARGTNDLVDNIKALHRACPKYHATVLNTSAKVNERTGRATVWVSQVIDGLPDGFRRESVNELTWIRKDGEWFCTKHRGLRGLCSGFPSEDGK